MAHVEIFYYYRQDVVNRCFDKRRFFQPQEQATAFEMAHKVLKSLWELKQEGSEDYEMEETYQIIIDENDVVTEERCVYVFGGSEVAGVVMQIQTSMVCEEGIGARASPQNRLGQNRIF